MNRMTLKVEDVMENEFDHIKVENFPQDVFTTLADLLTYDWQKFARCLSVDELEIDNIKEKYATTREQTMQMLNIWRKDNPSKQWQDMKSILLFCKRKDLISECERKLISRYSVFGVLLPTKDFFSRDDELMQIHTHLYQENDSRKKMTVLTGMSGVGKTQLARKYAEMYSNYFEKVVWLDASLDKMQTSMINLCHILGLSVKDLHGNAFDIEVVSAKIHNYFEREKTLYIFDNVDHQSIENFERYVSIKPNAFNLVTSQWKTWTTNAHQIKINPFSRQDAFDFLKTKVKTNDNKQVKEIIEVLQCHPLAINQAILYINNNNISLQNYLNLYQPYPVEILNEVILTETETKSAVTSISLVLNKLEITDEKSIELLNHLSYCDGQHITKQFIQDISKYLNIKDEILINHSVFLLNSYSLLDRFEGEHDLYAMHEMTQLASKYYQNRKEITEMCNKNFVKFLKLQLKNVKEHIDDGEHFYHHFLRMFHTYRPKMCEAFSKQSEKIRRFLSKKGFFQDIVNILDAIQDYNANFYGAKNEITLNSKDNLALCLSDMGKYNEALEIYYQVEKVQTDIFGINNESILATKHSIVSCLKNMGKYNEALNIYFQVEKIEIFIFGFNHPKRLGTKYDIACCLKNVGKYDDALEIYCQIEKIQTDILGINHPSILAIKRDIASDLKNMGKYNEALDIYYQVEKVEANILGSDHSSALATKQSIASCLKNVGKYNEALEIYCQIEKMQTDNLGVNHPSTLVTKHKKSILKEIKRREVGNLCCNFF